MKLYVRLKQNNLQSLSFHHLNDRAVCCRLHFLLLESLLGLLEMPKIFSVLHRPCFIVLVCTQVTK